MLRINIPDLKLWTPEYLPFLSLNPLVDSVSTTTVSQRATDASVQLGQNIPRMNDGMYGESTGG